MAAQTSFTYALDAEKQATLTRILRTGNYRPATVPHSIVAVDAENCRVVLYKSGKCVVQGRGAEDFVVFTLEPEVLGSATVGYEEELHPEASAPHMGVDESGKGDFFGPIVIAAAYVNPDLAARMKEMGVRDSKNITSDKKATSMAADLRELLGNRFALVTIGPASYNRLYLKMRNVNRMLAWGHARVIEDLLDRVPECPRAVSDQFGPKSQVERALMQRGRGIELEQRPKAESDIAVAAASILARGGFLHALQKLRSEFGAEIPKGASAAVRDAAVELVKQRGPEVLLRAAKCHFKTTDAVLAAAGSDRSALGPEGAATSRAVQKR